MTARTRQRAAWLLAGPGFGAVVLLVLDTSRPDRLGHFLAGFGATLAACWVAAVVSRGRAPIVVAACLACIALGHVVETVVFPLGGYDVLDVAAQSAGAVHAGMALVGGAAGDPRDDWFDLDRFAPSPYGRAVLLVAAVSLVLGAWRAFA